MAFKLFDRIQETASTTGTGAFTLSGAIPGFKTFASRYSTGDTLYYVIQDVDTAGAPDGDWEVGLGTYSAANTLTRTIVLSSSNSDALVSFASGEKRVSVTMTALQGGSIRERLTAARTYYVRSDGSDSNTGLANTSGGAFLTIQKAVDVVSSTLDMGAYQVTIQCNDATRTEAVVLRQCIGSLAPSIVGNTTTPANCTINTTGTCFTALACFWAISGFKLTATVNGISVLDNGRVTFASMDFGNCSGTYSAHVYTDRRGSVAATGNYTISSGAFAHAWFNYSGSFSCSGKTVTITGTPNFTGAFAYSRNGAMDADTTTWSGSATGTRYSLSFNGVVFANGGTLPGNTAGTTSTGGQFG
jgi:hypothetical protein